VRWIVAHKYKTVFVDIDTQHDFMDPLGALYVPQADRIVPNLRRLFAAATEYRVPVVSTADYHSEDDPEFTTYGFPAHCVAGTPGQQRLPDTLMPGRAVLDPDEPVEDIGRLLDRYAQLICRKRALDVWTSVAARRLLETIDADAWYVFGVATDYCVKSAALGLAKAGKRTYVVTDAVKAITPEGEQAAIQEMRSAGVQFLRTDDVLRRIKAAVASSV
jgi:nicotinamidase/pyrazinamidase